MPHPSQSKKQKSKNSNNSKNSAVNSQLPVNLVMRYLATQIDRQRRRNNRNVMATSAAQLAITKRSMKNTGNVYGLHRYRQRRAAWGRELLRLLQEDVVDVDAALHAIESGADTNAIKSGANATDTHTGTTALMLAAKRGLPTVCTMLLKYKAHVNATNNTGWTPLMYAAKGGYGDVVTILIQHGANVNYKTPGSKVTALYVSAQTGVGHGIMHLLLQHGAAAVVNTRSGDSEWTPLMRVGREGGDVEKVQMLLDHGAILNAEDVDGRTAVYIAAAAGYHGILHALLQQAGAHVNTKDKDGKTALMAAASKGGETGVKMLLDHGAHPNIQSHYKMTALMFAAESRNIGGVLLLLQHGAKKELKDSMGQTALQYGMKSQNRLNRARLYTLLQPNPK